MKVGQQVGLEDETRQRPRVSSYLPWYFPDPRPTVLVVEPRIEKLGHSALDGSMVRLWSGGGQQNWGKASVT
jgi:hypothetical protein